ncbi:MAG: tetratricopeptide repeat protein [Lentisphaerae bacterium]|jgi:predicted Zn-dependent protease|nr:tetratricopeptide repeat protein [Lentisphaerota bacterium]
MSEEKLDAADRKGWERVRWLTAGALSLGALALYLVTMSRGAFPGLPAFSMSSHLGLDAGPSLLDSLWGRMIRLLAWLPGEGLACRASALSALFGALSVGLLTMMVMRIRYKLHDAYDPDECRRENQARWLAGVTAGLGAAISIPFWVASTRSLPDTFHVFLLLGAAFLLSEYQRTGRDGFLYALGLVYGVGVTEFATFWLMAPLAAVLVLRAMLQRASFSWRVVFGMLAWTVPGLLLYVWNGWTLWANEAVKLRGFQSAWTVIWYIWRDQWHQIVRAPQTTGFLIVVLITVLPWGVMFLMRPKKPAWRFSAWQVVLRLSVLIVAAGTLINAPGAAWRAFGMYFLLVTPYLILAACAGAVAGEFWVMGQVREHRNAGVGQPLRGALGKLGALMPLLLVGAGFWNLTVADGRPGSQVTAAVNHLLDALEERDVLLSPGWWDERFRLDDVIRVQALDRGQDVVVIGMQQMTSKHQRDYLARRFTHPRQQALLQVGFRAFLQDFLADDANQRRTAILDMAESVREFGYLIPDRLIYRLTPDEPELDWAVLVESQRAFWEIMEAWGAEKLDEANPAWHHRAILLRVASKVANNVGFALVERGETDAAEPLFHQARRLLPDNISALLNLMTLAQAADKPELEDYQADWERIKESKADSRVMWALGSLYGYVHNTGYLTRHGMMWAVSGKPQMAEAEMRRASGGRAMDPRVKAFLGRAYLKGGDVQRGAAYYREAIAENPKDARSLLMLAQLAIQTEDFAEAEQLLAQAEEAGVPAANLRFERIVLAYLQGKPDDALAGLQQLVKEQRDDARAWALLAQLSADGRNPKLYDQAIKALEGLRADSPDIRLMLAELHVSREEWGKARAELEQVTRMNPRQTRAWEMLLNVDFSERKQELAEDHVRILLTLDPGNFTGNMMLGSLQYGRSQYALAESSYRAALNAHRAPVVLNDLAYLLILKGGALAEARELIEEAVGLQPGNPLFLSTRGELLLLEGKLDAAEADLEKSLSAMPDNPPVLLLVARLYAARGQRDAARETANALLNRQEELSAEQRTALQTLYDELQ